MHKEKQDNRYLWNRIYIDGNQNKYPWDSVVSFIYNYCPKGISHKKIKILEVGCGTASNLWFAAREGFNVSGIDFSKKAIEVAKKRFNKDNLKYKLEIGSFTKLPFQDNLFDIVVDRASLTCVTYDDAKIAINEIHRVLKKGGKFLFTPYSTTHESFQSQKNNKDGFVKRVSKGNLRGVGHLCFYNKRRILKILKDWKSVSINHIIKKDIYGKVRHAEWEVIVEKK